jgi:cell wall-associated NlpC family hydrolase
VFFKTGVFTRHVGMYLDDGDFLHAASSNGVTISNLEDRYWTRTYWKARRIQ